MDRSESLDLTSLIVLFDRIAELGRLANAANEVVEDAGVASKKSAGSAISTSDNSIKKNDDDMDQALCNVEREEV